MHARTTRTLLFALAYPVWIYFVLDFVIRSGLQKTSAAGLLVMLGTGLVSCAAAWLVVRPTRIRWVRWPSWSFALAGAGYLVRAWLLANGRPWSEVLALAVFYLIAVGFQEEFIYRGCVEEGLAELGPWASAILAGLFFGLCHAPLAILRGQMWVWAVISPLGGGLVYHLVMRWLRDKAGLGIPVSVHGLLDFLGAQ